MGARYAASFMTLSRCLLLCAATAFSVAGCASSPSKPAPVPIAAPAPDYKALVAAADRSQEDRDLDEGRKPAELLAFMDVRAGWVVADLGAGAGYTTELLARAVGPTGKVYAQNSAMAIEKFVKESWPARLAKPINKNVVRLDREFDLPFPAEAKGLDLVVMNLFYHDTFWFGTDRKSMNENIFNALRSGGAFIVIDHSGRKGTGTTEVKTLHRVEESELIADVQGYGFKLQTRGEFLRNPSDTRDWMVFKEGKRGSTDRFVLKFVKP